MCLTSPTDSCLFFNFKHNIEHTPSAACTAISIPVAMKVVHAAAAGCEEIPTAASRHVEGECGGSKDVWTSTRRKERKRNEKDTELPAINHCGRRR